MFEKVNPSHPDKVADRIAGAIVDLAYSYEANPKVAVEVLIGHHHCFIIIEASVVFDDDIIKGIVHRITGTDDIECKIITTEQDAKLASNQANGMRCGDNGIFKGVPVSDSEKHLTWDMKFHYKHSSPTDGKAIVHPDGVTFCLSNVDKTGHERECLFNPIGVWSGGTDVDTGATNRKLGSDMGRAVTGGGLHGKDLSKADVSVNIWCHLMAQRCNRVVSAWCSIGDDVVGYMIEGIDGKMSVGFGECVREARKYIKDRGGFEKFAEWGLIYSDKFE